MQLHIFHDTVITVKYNPNSEPYIITGAGQTYVNPRDILVIFDGPVRVKYTGRIFERGGAITVDRINGVKRWGIRLGTPFDDNYFHKYDVPETDIPEAVVQAVTTFIQSFEKGA